MRICIDASPVANRPGGIARYSQKLTTTLARAGEDVVTFCSSGNLRTRDAELGRLPNLTLDYGPRQWRLAVLLAHLFSRPQDRLFPGVDVFHATDYVLPRLSAIRGVFTLHDLTFLLFPTTHTLLSRFFHSLTVRRFLRQADAIVADSECTRGDAARLCGVEPAKIQVIHLGVDPCFQPATEKAKTALREKLGLPSRIILALGTLEPRKNLVGLVRAYSLLRKRGVRHRLVITGEAGWRYKDFFRAIRDLGLGEHVSATGYLPDCDLPALYSCAEVFAFPSLYEGFGLPVLEAMACGTPVACSSASSLAEVAGPAAAYFDPNRTTGIADAIEELLNDSSLRHCLSEKGRIRASGFSWERTAQETAAVYRRVSR